MRVKVIPFNRQVQQLEEQNQQLQAQVEQLQTDLVELIEENKALRKKKKSPRGLSHKLTGLRNEVSTVLTHTLKYPMVTTGPAYQKRTARLRRLVKHKLD